MSSKTNFPKKTLSREQVLAIHRASLRILAETGVVIHHPQALELLRAAGAEVIENRAFIPQELVDSALFSAPKSVTLYNREGKAALFLEDSYVNFGMGSDTLNILDPFTGAKRKWRKDDVAKGIKICDYLPNIDFTMSLGLLSDVPRRTINREQYAIMLRNSIKPQVVIAEDKEALADMLEMAAIVLGGKEEFRKRPLFMLYTEPTSPLQHPFESVDKLLFCAANGIPTNFASGGVAGATTPVTVAGAVVQENAECLSGLVIHQLQSSGAPFLYGYGNSPLDMKTMQAVYATPEAIQLQGCLCDLGRFYGLPTWGYAGMNNSKTIDPQAIMEAALFTLAGAQQGCNIMHDVFYMEFGTTGCLEEIVIVDEIIGRVKKMIGEVDTGSESLAVEAIDRVGPGGDFLGDMHTLEHFRGSWSSELSDFTYYDNWVKNGRKTMLDRARDKVDAILAGHVPPALSPEADEKITALLASAAQRLAD